MLNKGLLSVLVSSANGSTVEGTKDILHIAEIVIQGEVLLSKVVVGFGTAGKKRDVFGSERVFSGLVDLWFRSEDTMAPLFLLLLSLLSFLLLLLHSGFQTFVDQEIVEFLLHDLLFLPHIVEASLSKPITTSWSQTDWSFGLLFFARNRYIYLIGTYCRWPITCQFSI